MKAGAGAGRGEQVLIQRGFVRSGCTWKVCWNRFINRSGQSAYHLTTTRTLTHNHPLPDSPDTTTIYSLKKVTVAIEDLLLGLLNCDITGESQLRRFVEQQTQQRVEQSVFHHLLNKLKAQIGVAQRSGETGEFKQLLLWCVTDISAHDAYARFDVTENHEICRLLYMSRDMRHNFERNGQVLIMDSTHKTNRFNWPLLLVCGINEHFQTVILGVALVAHSTTESFAWVLQTMQSALSERAWADIRTVATDGEAAMEAAIEAVIPHAHRLRCWYHLEQNLRSNLYSSFPTRFDDFLKAWRSVAGAEDESSHHLQRAQLHTDFPASEEYLVNCIWKNTKHFAECHTKGVCTLGIFSTQRVEGMNSRLKGSLGVNSKTPLKVLFNTLQHAASDIDRVAITRKHAAELKQKPVHGTVEAATHNVISCWAQKQVQQQWQLQHNYELKQSIEPGGDGSTVWIVRHLTSAGQKPHKVVATLTSMRCSCGYPATYLLPCRHVLSLNHPLHLTPFLRSQIGQRWLLSYMPPTDYTPLRILPSAHISFDPSFLTSVAQQNVASTQPSQYGQLMGLCKSLCDRASEDVAVYPAAYERLMELTDWVMQRTSECVEQGAAAVSEVAISNSSHVTSLNPTVPISAIIEPAAPKKRRGRVAEARKPSQGEAGTEGGKKRGKKSARISLTQPVS